MTKLLAFILLLFHAVCVFATDTLVWKVSKKNEPTSYLVGTMHVAPKSFRLPENIRQSLNKSKVLVLETDLLDETKIKPADMVQMMYLMQSSRSLEQMFGKQRLNKLRNYLSHNPQGQELLLLLGGRPRPWVIWSELEYTFLPAEFSRNNGIDEQLQAQAKQQGKLVYGLETLEATYMFAALPEEAVLRSIDTSLQHEAMNRKLMQQAWKLYAAQKTTALMQLLDDPNNEQYSVAPQDRALMKHFSDEKIIKQRNLNWLPKIQSYLAKQPTTIAVGTAHLFGQNGLIILLQKQGYTVLPVLP